MEESAAVALAVLKDTPNGYINNYELDIDETDGDGDSSSQHCGQSDPRDRKHLLIMIYLFFHNYVNNNAIFSHEKQTL